MNTTIDALVEALNGLEVAKGWLQVSDRNHAVGYLAKYIASAEAALAQARAEQAEPVAWRYRLRGDLQWQYTERVEVAIQPIYETESVFTTPPAAPVAKLEPLTEDEIGAIAVYEVNNSSDCFDDLIDFARAIEAAHNAKLSKA